VRSFLRDLNRQRGVTVLLTTHDMFDIERLCSRLFIVDHGRLLYDAGLEEMRARLGYDSTLEHMMRQFYERTSRELLAELETEVEMNPGRLRVARRQVQGWRSREQRPGAVPEISKQVGRWLGPAQRGGLAGQRQPASDDVGVRARGSWERSPRRRHGEPPGANRSRRHER
jgi:ABC-type multidrug transport system ATPase subunit